MVVVLKHVHMQISTGEARKVKLTGILQRKEMLRPFLLEGWEWMYLIIWWLPVYRARPHPKPPECLSHTLPP